MAAIYSFYIINKSGDHIFYKDYGSAGRMDTNDSLRLASLWHSMHAISQQLSPVSGCSGIELLQADTFDLNCFQSLTNEKGKFDELVEDKGVKILIDPKALMHVIGTEMDFVDDKLRSEFIFINPNSAVQCGCGESFMTMSSSETTKRGGGPGTLVVLTSMKRSNGFFHAHVLDLD